MGPSREPLGDRRREPRLERDDLAVVIQRRGARPLATEPSVVDLSPGGVGLYLAGEARVGEALDLRIMLPDGPVGGAGRVVWARPHHLGVRFGVRIERMPWLQSHRLYYFLRRDDLDPLKALDIALLAAFLTTAAVLVLDFLGLTLGKVLEVAVFIAKRL